MISNVKTAKQIMQALMEIFHIKNVFSEALRQTDNSVVYIINSTLRVDYTCGYFTAVQISDVQNGITFYEKGFTNGRFDIINDIKENITDITANIAIEDGCSDPSTNLAKESSDMFGFLLWNATMPELYCKYINVMNKKLQADFKADAREITYRCNNDEIIISENDKELKMPLYGNLQKSLIDMGCFISE